MKPANVSIKCCVIYAFMLIDIRRKQIYSGYL